VSTPILHLYQYTGCFIFVSNVANMVSIHQALLHYQLLGGVGVRR